MVSDDGIKALIVTDCVGSQQLLDKVASGEEGWNKVIPFVVHTPEDSELAQETCSLALDHVPDNMMAVFVPDFALCRWLIEDATEFSVLNNVSPYPAYVRNGSVISQDEVALVLKSELEDD